MKIRATLKKNVSKIGQKNEQYYEKTETIDDLKIRQN